MIDGRRLGESLKTRDWQRAIRRAAALENPDSPRVIAIGRAIEAFKIHCRDLAEGTRIKYWNIMKHLGAFFAGNNLSEVRVEDLNAYRASRPIGRVTGLKELQTLRQFFSFCSDQGWVRDNPAKRIKPPKGIKPRPVEPYTHSEIDRMIVSCDQIGRTGYERKRARALLLLLRHTALRITDAMMLARDRVRDEKLMLYTMKTGGQVFIPLPKELLDALAELPAPRDASLPCRHYFWNGKMIPRTIKGIAERTLKAVFREAQIQNGHAHRFRHTLATEILTRGGTEQDVADILGISPAIVRKHYAKWTPARQERILDVLARVQAATFLLQTEKTAAIN